MNKKHGHQEAFCLMQYKCDKCNHIEFIWNARDGVTPMMISCKNPFSDSLLGDCNGVMTHINWDKDKYLPDYIPSSGQLVFISMPKELRAPLAREIAKAANSKNDKEAIQGIINSFHKDEPWLIEWP